MAECELRAISCVRNTGCPKKVDPTIFLEWLAFESKNFGAATSLASNVTIVNEVRSASAHLFAGMWRPLVSVITTFYYLAIIIFHHRV